VVVSLLGLAVLAALTPPVPAQNKPVTIVRRWKGSVADADPAEDAPAYVADPKALEKLRKKWGVEGKVPEVDFKKEIVIGSTAVGSRLNLSARLDDKGNLGVLGVGRATSGRAPAT
jgi:hypothetical protein